MAAQYPISTNASSTALDAFSGEGRLARRAQKDVTRALMQHMVESVKHDSRLYTRARMAQDGAMVSMDTTRRIGAYANGEPVCVEIGAAWVGVLVRESIADFEGVSRRLA